MKNRSDLDSQKIPLDPKESRKRKRERLAIVLLTILFFALLVFEFKLTKVSTTLPLVNSIFFFGLLNINIILLIAVTWLIARNVGKLFFERRSRVLGARLKTKLVVAFAAFSITPTLVLFLISSLYINSSFDKWFSLRIQNTLEGSIQITKTYYENAERNAVHFADHIAEQLSSKIPSFGSSVELGNYLEGQQSLLALNALEFYPDPFEHRIVAQQSPSKGARQYPRLSLDLLDQVFSGQKKSVIQHVGSGDLIRTIRPVYHAGTEDKIAGVLAVSSYIPVSLVNKVDEIATVFDDYKGTNPLKYPIKTTYFVILVMITLVIIFVAIWLGLYLARELTVPVERLVQGVRQVGRGNLDVTIERAGEDEITTLVDAFNKMTGHLRDNRSKLTQRTVQLEAVLANVGTGVIVADRSGVITTFNRAASTLLSMPVDQALGHPYEEILTGEAKPIAELIRKSFETPLGKATPEISQIHYKSGGESKLLAGIATSLEDKNETWGTVLVIDEMTHIVKAQREVAWREVARRIAHEIKNPLTPIKLSAQRLQRQLGTKHGKEGALLQECTDTIVKHTDELKEMVDEFSNFARLPQVNPSQNDLNQAIQELLTLFSQAHPNIHFRVNLEERVPNFEFDRDQIKRVMMNLIDNAVSAIRDKTQPSIHVYTYYNEQLQMAVAVVGDNGPGMSNSVKARVFEPYFSTKKGGTGLGLAIAKRIVNDHDGFIRVQSSAEEGTQFWIELPTSPRQTLGEKSPRSSRDSNSTVVEGENDVAPYPDRG